MKHILVIGTLLVGAQAIAQAPPQPRDNSVQQASGQISHDPWDVVPTVAPYRNLAATIKATSKTGGASPLNPSCEGMTGDACVRGEKPKR